MGSLIPLFWTSGDVCPGFQSQGGSLARFVACVILRFNSGVTPADSIKFGMATKPFRFTLEGLWTGQVTGLGVPMGTPWKEPGTKGQEYPLLTDRHLQKHNLPSYFVCGRKLVSLIAKF